MSGSFHQSDKHDPRVCPVWIVNLITELQSMKVSGSLELKIRDGIFLEDTAQLAANARKILPRMKSCA